MWIKKRKKKKKKEGISSMFHQPIHLVMDGAMVGLAPPNFFLKYY